MSSSGDKLWQGRASGEVHDIMIQMGESISLDIELYREDLYGSYVHASMLHRIGIISEDELVKIVDGLRGIKSEIENNQLTIRPELEDIHTHIENRLIELIGDTGKKLHTARSRNDQVALDTHLFVRRLSYEIASGLIELCSSLYERAREHVDIIVPAYTHLQVAQPIRLSHHLLAHFWSFERDISRLFWASEESARLPLGSGALAGVNYDTDREYLCNTMDFVEIYANSMDAVASRDHILNFLYAVSVFLSHASRFCEEIILWNSQEFGFITLPDALTTGSSIMPQKKNPDLAELIRGKAGRVMSNLNSLFITVKGLPYAYNRDLQEDRQPLLDSARQSLLASRGLTAMVQGMKFNGNNLQRSLEMGFASATDLADALVSIRKVNFRDAHHLVGKLVARCVELNVSFQSITTEERAQVSEHFRDDRFYLEAIDVPASVDRKISYGGTALKRQKEQLKEAENSLQKLKNLEWRRVDYNF